MPSTRASQAYLFILISKPVALSAKQDADKAIYLSAKGRS